MKRAIGLFLGCLLFALTSAANADTPRELTIYGAASLTNALQDIGTAFAAGGGAKVKFSFAASSLLARQIEAGAPADMFFSADTEWMTYLADRNLIQPATRKDVLSERTFVPSGRPSKTTAVVWLLGSLSKEAAIAASLCA